MTTQANLNIMPRVNAMESTMSSRFRDFVKLNPPIFLRSKVNEDPQDFLDDIYKVLRLIRVTPR